MKLSSTIVVVFVFFNSYLFSQTPNYNPCDGVFLPVFEKLSVNTDKQYLEKLRYIYSSTSETEFSSRNSSSGNLIASGYGSAAYNSDKSKVEKIYSSYDSQEDYSLSVTDKLTLNGTFSRTENVQQAIDAWQTCIAIRSNIPALELLEQSDSIVQVRFRMYPTMCRKGSDKVAITGITAVNLTLLPENTIKINDKIKYDGTYTLIFRRKNLDKASVAIDLEEGIIIPVNVPAFDNQPKYKTIKESKTIEFRVDANISENWLELTNPNGSKQPRVTYGNTKGRYLIPFPVFTNLNAQKVTITDHFYEHATGAWFGFTKGEISIKDGLLYLSACKILTGHSPIRGKLKVFYEQEKQICIANCP
ncbi:MAG: hypothetical protein KA149_05960 [Chitinophagales bacterium]|nr:hypothetical protein [Chitinophagales bacterium]